MTKKVFSQHAIDSADDLTGNLMPLLHEVRHALDRLLENDEPTSIDLRSIPLGPGEEDRILSFLGQGEVNARLDLLGPSDVCETRYAGVWIVTHYNHDNQLLSRVIEVTRIPDVLCSQTGDISTACSRLAAILEDLRGGGQKDKLT